MNQSLLLLAALTACTTDMPERGGPIVRDSAGIRIIESQSPVWQPGTGWHLGGEPLTHIGTKDGAEYEEFADVRGVLSLADGTLVIADGASRQLRFFSHDGQFVSSIGRAGQGPGEFRSITDIWDWPGDSVAVWDRSLVRLSVYSSAGVLGRTQTYAKGESLAPGVSGAPVAVPNALGFYSDGTLAAYFTVPRRSPLGETPQTMYRDSVTVWRFLTDGSPGDIVASVLGDEWFFFSWQGSITNAKHPMGRRLVTAISGEHFYYTPGDSYEVSVYSSDGKLERIVRRLAPPLPLTVDEIARYRELAMREAPPGQERTWRRWLDEEMPYPPSFPTYSRLVVDREENIWAQQYPLISDSTPRWTVFDRAGRLLGDVTFPDRFHSFEIGADYVVGVWRDELDVEHVRLYDLVKPEQ